MKHHCRYLLEVPWQAFAIPRGRSTALPMEEKVKINNLKKMGLDDSVFVKGKLKPQAKGFGINLGQDSSNLLIHFNVRFDENVVVYNSMRRDGWMRETRDSHFPFKQGENTKMRFTLNDAGVTMIYPDGYMFDYEPQIKLDSVKYVSVTGDMEVKFVEIQ